MEQLVARKAHNLEVPGSSPGPGTCKQKPERAFVVFDRFAIFIYTISLW